MSAALERLDDLVSPLGGVVARTRLLGTLRGDPSYAVAAAELGDLAATWPEHRRRHDGETTRGGTDGAGSGLEEGLATRIAVAEALERYSASTYRDEQFVWASARELGDDALDLASLPRCSTTELADEGCPVCPADPRAPIRWVRGLRLSDLRPTLIPAILCYLHVNPRSVGERFTLPISTGHAAHSDPVAAIVSGLCEVIERDAIAITWLQMLKLPRLRLDARDDDLSEALRRRERAHVQAHLFDATTDLGVPTVYLLELAPHNPRVAQLVMCATHLDPMSAVVKVLREAASSRIALNLPRETPEHAADFTRVHHGAVRMGRPEEREAFRFLESSSSERSLSELPRLATGSAQADLAVLLARLRAAGMEAYAIDLTTDEALRVGFRVVRVLVPALQPLSFHHRARFLAHPRLYDAPRQMGHPVRDEPELNGHPQPFA
jgi:ribosomal protein S12 methylthiotransferase accessory factor